jgi:hypothetical protein
VSQLCSCNCVPIVPLQLCPDCTAATVFRLYHCNCAPIVQPLIEASTFQMSFHIPKRCELQSCCARRWDSPEGFKCNPIPCKPAGSTCNPIPGNPEGSECNPIPRNPGGGGFHVQPYVTCILGGSTFRVVPQGARIRRVCYRCPDWSGLRRSRSAARAGVLADGLWPVMPCLSEAWQCERRRVGSGGAEGGPGDAIGRDGMRLLEDGMRLLKDGVRLVNMGCHYSKMG